MKRNVNGRVEATPVMLDAKGAAEMIGISRATLWRYRDRGLLPQPVRVGSLQRWLVSDLAEWMRARCPNVDGRNSTR